MQRDSGRATAPGRNLVVEAHVAPGTAGCFHYRAWAGTGHRMLLGVSSHTSTGGKQAPSLTGSWAGELSEMLLRMEVWGRLGIEIEIRAVLSLFPQR